VEGSVSANGKLGPRARLIRAASKLTYALGTGVRIDAILQEAGVARRSLYEPLRRQGRTCC
jgi:hypothetical protein